MTNRPNPVAWAENIMQYPVDERPLFALQPMPVATKNLINLVRDDLDIEDVDFATRVADWVAEHFERYAAAFAAPMFDMDGNGPLCSYCHTPWPFCGHQRLSGDEWEFEQKNPDLCETPDTDRDQ